MPVVGDERASGLGEHLEPVPDHLGRVVGTGPGQQSLQQDRLGHVQVDGGIECDPEPLGDVESLHRLRHGPGKPVQDVPAAGSSGGHHRNEQVEDDLVRDQVAAALVAGDLAAERSADPDLAPQHLPGGDVLDAVE